MNPILRGRVSAHGKLVLDDPGEGRRWLQSLANADVEVIIRKRRLTRSQRQNAYWWAVPVKLLSEHTGYDAQQMHYALLGECFGWWVGPTGHLVPNVAASKHLTVDQFTRLIEWVLVWGPTEMDVAIPAPDDVELSREVA
jgi:hypothetical protein